MGLFGFGGKSNVVDLAEKYRQQREQDKEGDNAERVGDSLEFSETDTAADRRKKLAKRILDMSSKIEDLASKMYDLQQRIELLERKNTARGE